MTLRSQSGLESFWILFHTWPMKLPILIHPILVHFPIAFYFLELVLLSLWRFKKDNSYFRFARFTFRLGYLFMILAMAAGLIDVKGSNILQEKCERTYFLR